MSNGLETNNFTVNNQAAKKSADALQKAAGTNPNAQLDKDAFMKLLLTELQYQDPTSPMDTEKMLTQTSQLASLEMQENTNKMMQKLADQLKNSTNMYAVGVLGKMAKIGDSGIVKEEGASVKFAGFLESAAKGGTINIRDNTGKLVRTLEFGEAKAGANTFEWDGKDSAGNDAKAGSYSVEINYVDLAGKAKSGGVGNYLVEGVKFIDGVAQVKVGGQYVSIDKVKEFTEPSKG
jgi:flagellar hook capping protein